MESKAPAVSRRAFVSSLVAAAIAAGVVGYAGGRATRVTETVTTTQTVTQPVTITKTQTVTQTVPVTVTVAPGIPPPPAPVPDAQIKEVVEADVVVVGAGIAGLMAANSAAEEGAKVVVIEKHFDVNLRGAHINPGPGGKLLKEAGITVDYEKALREQIDVISGGKVDEKLLRQWMLNATKVTDFLVDLAKANNVFVGILKVDTYLEEAWKEWPRPTYKWHPVADYDGFANIGPVLKKRAEGMGVRFYFETPAVYLIRDAATGRVTGVVAQRLKDKAYLKFVAKKAVILATGDYCANKDLLKLWAPPEVARLADMPGRITLPAITPTNTGDGQLMGLWIGADMDEPPHCPLCYISIPGDPGYSFAVLSGHGPGRGKMLTCNPFLFVNKRGERFVNESLPWMWVINRVLQQPDAEYWAVFDSRYAEVVKKHGGGYRRINDPEIAREFLDGALKAGAAVQADTLDELARKMEVPVDAFKSTVERYNELCRKGYDEDYGKPARYLDPIERPPFYAVKGIAILLNMVGGGLKVNERLQVLDKQGRPIPGLYAAGNIAGGFYAQYYSLVVLPGLSHSRAATQGYLAGKFAVRYG